MQDERTDGELDPFMEELICFVIIQGEITAVPNFAKLCQNWKGQDLFVL